MLDEVVFWQEGDGHCGRLEPQDVRLVLREETHGKAAHDVGRHDRQHVPHRLLWKGTPAGTSLTLTFSISLVHE